MSVTVTGTMGFSGKSIINLTGAPTPPPPPPPPTDSYYTNVSLLMHYDGYNDEVLGLPTTPDNSPNTKIASAHGNASISTSTVKFGAGSLYLDGSGDYLTVPANTDFVFGTGNFTIECWIYLPTNPSGSYAAITDIRSSPSGSGAVLFAINSSRQLVYYSDASMNSTGTVSLNTWTHVALVRSSGGTVTFYIDGVASGSVGDSANKSQNPNVFIGRVYDDANPAFNGYIDDLRITKGVARYTTNFAPPNAAFPNSYPSDTYYNQVSLLLHVDSFASVGTGFIDNSKYAFTPSSTGTPTIKTAQYEFGGSSMYVGGENTVNFTSNSAFAIGTSDFTFETWAYINSFSPSNQSMINIGAYDNGLLFRFSGANTIQLYINGSGFNFSTASAITTSTWHHVAISRNSGSVRVFLDGVQQGSTGTITSNIPQGAIKIGASQHIGGEYINGYLDDLRLTVGVGRYANNFTPPTSAFPNS